MLILWEHCLWTAPNPIVDRIYEAIHSLHGMGGQGQPYEVEKILGLNGTQKDKKGFFIEAGAVDGEYLSNTLFFEMKYDWTGLLVEPNPAQLKELYTKHRKAYILPHCLSTKTEVEIVTFEVSDVLSGIMLDGKVRPSRIDDPNPGRSDKKYERKIQVLNIKTKWM